MDPFASLTFLRNSAGAAWAPHHRAIGILSLRDDRLLWSDHEGQLAFDHPVGDVSGVRRRWYDLGTNVHFGTPDGVHWTAAFYFNRGYGRNQTLEEPAADPVGILWQRHDPTNWREARGVARDWFDLLREATTA